MNATQRLYEQVVYSLEATADECGGDRGRLLKTCAHSLKEAALGLVRYEALRVLSPNEFGKLWERNILGENFDDLVDELVKQTA